MRIYKWMVLSAVLLIANVSSYARGEAAPAVREITAEHHWLLFPVRNQAPLRRTTVIVDGKVVRWFGVELADDKPDWWGALDITPWAGKTLTIGVDQLPTGSHGLDQIYASDTIPGSENLYHEALRPQIHFSAQRGWINDPNGLVFYRGEYHLFFQHSPFSWGDGPKFWGHAVSKDLVHWREVDEALYPGQLGPMWSVSAVVDANNSSGFGTSANPPMVLMYTAAGEPFTQCIAYSTDARHFTKYSENPVIQNISGGNRDPLAFWDEAAHCWVVAVYVEDHGHTIHFFTSSNLRDWKLASSYNKTDGNFLFECPDIFEIPLDGKADQMKWILTSANGEYAVGNFDGKQFTAETSPLHALWGEGFYAAQTFNSEPQGRRVQIGWMQTATPGMPFNQSMSLPMELKLVSTADGPRLTRTPVKELESLRDRAFVVPPQGIGPETANPLAKINAELLELRTQFTPEKGAKVAFNIRGVSVVYDVSQQQLSVNNHTAPAPLVNGKQNLIIYVDRTSVEVFASGGLTYVPLPINLNPMNQSLSVSVEGAPVQFDELDAYQLKSAWR
ncbi:MAG TPA: glycoside hydrolase family 32 protein [Tepidisphaeraceae bacterium]